MARPTEKLTTIPIYLGLANGFETHATGTLVGTAGKVFLVTAHHVIEGLDEILVGGKPFFSIKTGDFIYCKELDLAFRELVEKEKIALELFKNVFPINLSASWQRSHGFPSGTARVFGFPASLIDVDGDILSAECSPLDLSSSITSQLKIRHMGLNADTQFAVDTKRLFDGAGKQIQKLNYRGLSGGAAFVELPRFNYILAGILIEHSPRHNVLIATQTWPLQKAILRRLGSSETSSEHT